MLKHILIKSFTILGMARGDTSRVWDFYTRDRSTPRRDQYFGGQSDLTASMAWEEDGETTIFFRKKLKVISLDQHLIPAFRVHNNHCAIFTCPLKCKGLFCTHNPVLYAGVTEQIRLKEPQTFPPNFLGFALW